jgi:hypothetical protein
MSPTKPGRRSSLRSRESSEICRSGALKPSCATKPSTLFEAIHEEYLDVMEFPAGRDSAFRFRPDKKGA